MATRKVLSISELVLEIFEFVQAQDAASWAAYQKLNNPFQSLPTLYLKKQLQSQTERATPPRRTLLDAGKTCKFLLLPALDVLWRELKSWLPLLKLFNGLEKRKCSWVSLIVVSISNGS